MNYWNDRYKSGGNSGKGSIGKYRRWKWKHIKKNIGIPEDVIDVGCGDLSFWKYKRTPKKYVGIDSSPFIIAQNHVKWPRGQFICCDAVNNEVIQAETVMCMDVLFHIMDDEDYDRILDNLIKYSSRYVVIYTWVNNPLSPKTKDNYQCFRPMGSMAAKFREAGFELKYLKNVPYDEYGALFIWERRPVDDSYLY